MLRTSDDRTARLLWSAYSFKSIIVKRRIGIRTDFGFCSRFTDTMTFNCSKLSTINQIYALSYTTMYVQFNFYHWIKHDSCVDSGHKMKAAIVFS